MQNSDDATRTAIVVYNPVKIDETTLRSQVERYAPDGWHIEWVRTTPDDSGEAEVAAAHHPDV